MTTPEYDVFYQYPAGISGGGEELYCRAEGSNEYLQFVFRKVSDTPDPTGWQGPYPIGTRIRVVFDMTIEA